VKSQEFFAMPVYDFILRKILAHLGHLDERAQLPDTILEEDHPITIPSKFGFN
jgi:hypothetical protein